jgi:hypothetical protein
VGSIAVIIILTVALAIWIMAPLSHAQTASAADSVTNEDLLDRQQRAANLLKDVELDFAMGKMTAEDYEKLRGELSKP